MPFVISWYVHSLVLTVYSDMICSTGLSFPFTRLVLDYPKISILSSYSMSLFASLMLTFLFSLCFLLLCHLTLMTPSILITVHMSHPLCYLLILLTTYQVP
jgi:hypothetical protein